MTDITTGIRDFILANHLQGESPENLRDDTPLVSSGILDSLGILGLVTFIEKQHGIELSVHDTTVERFDSLADITATITRKTQGVTAR